jgi:hypothetical protein
MKNVITFVVGVVVGILVIHGYDRSVTDYQQMTSDQTRASSAKKAQWNPASKEPLAIDYGKPLFITDQTGDEFQLILFGVLGQPIIRVRLRLGSLIPRGIDDAVCPS